MAIDQTVEKLNKARLLTTTVQNCARCGGSHRDMRFAKLDNPVEIKGVEYTHAGLCTTTNQSVLLRVVEY